MSRFNRKNLRIILSISLALSLFILPLTYTGILFKPAQAATLTFSAFVGVNGPVGIAYSSTTNRLIVAANYFSTPILEQIDSTGSVTTFAPSFTGADEVYLAVSPGQGGFTAGTVFAGNGTTPTISKISADGTVTTSAWALCNGAGGAGGFGGAFRGGFAFDTVGSFGNRLLALSTNGKLFSVDPTGSCTLIADTGPVLGICPGPAGACPLAEAITVAPTTFGSFGGQAIIGGSSGYLTAVSSTGVITTRVGGFTGLGELENLNFVSSTTNSLFENSFGQFQVIRADSGFTSADVGTLIVGQDTAPPAEGGTNNNILQFAFTGTTYVMNTLVSGMSQFEGAIIASLPRVSVGGLEIPVNKILVVAPYATIGIFLAGTLLAATLYMRRIRVKSKPTID